jgi:hypothetical protein
MKRLRLILLVVMVLIGGGLAWQLFENREPRYQGRNLTQWLEIYNDAAASAAKTNRMDTIVEARNAVRSIGTNAVPFLLKKLSARETPIERRFKRLAGSQSWIHFHFANRRTLAYAGFHILGEEARSAAPALAQLTRHRDREVRFFALESLSSLNLDAASLLPTLLQVIHDPDPDIRSIAAQILSNLSPEEAEKAGVYHEFPELKLISTQPSATETPLRDK